MTPEVVQKIENFFQPYKSQSFDKGQILVQAGEDPPGIFYVLNGHIRQYDISGQGYEAVVNVFKSPAFFPMSWAINKTTNDYFFEAASNVDVKIAPAENVVEFLRQNADVTFDLLSRVYLGTDGLLKRMAQLMSGSAKVRLMLELLIEAQRFGKLQNDGSYLIDIHEDELGKRAGLSRETVSRELSKINSQNLVSVSRKGILVKDIKRLEQELA